MRPKTKFRMKGSRKRPEVASKVTIGQEVICIIIEDSSYVGGTQEGEKYK